MMKKILSLVCIALFANFSNGAIIDNGTYTTDTESGLDWLDVNVTSNLSFNEVTELMKPEGAYDGWRYATVDEFEQLVSNFGVPSSGADCSFGLTFCSGQFGTNPLILEVTSILGPTVDEMVSSGCPEEPCQLYYIQGMLGENVSNALAGNINYAEIYSGASADSEGVFRPWQQITAAMTTDKEYYDESLGSFLVRTSEVPVPAAAWLFASALLGLVGIQRKK